MRGVRVAWLGGVEWNSSNLKYVPRIGDVWTMEEAKKCSKDWKISSRARDRAEGTSTGDSIILDRVSHVLSRLASSNVHPSSSDYSSLLRRFRLPSRPRGRIPMFKNSAARYFWWKMSNELRIQVSGTSYLNLLTCCRFMSGFRIGRRGQWWLTEDREYGILDLPRRGDCCFVQEFDGCF